MAAASNTTTPSAPSQRARTRAAKPAQRQVKAPPLPPPVHVDVPPGWDDPRTFPDVFAMSVTGNCMAPEAPHGSHVIVDKTLPCNAGDLVVIFFRPDRHKPGRDRAWVKRLELNVAPWVRQFPYEDSPDSNVAAVLMLAMNDPPKSIVVKADEVWAMYRCLGQPNPAKYRITKGGKA